MKDDLFNEDLDYKILARRIEDKRDRRTFQKVFDSKTLDTVQALAQKGLFDVLEHIISTGKEAHVFIARDSAGNKRAVKIFKKETSNFKRMDGYIRGDIRFRDVPRDRRSLVLAWTRKEYKNLLVATRANLRVPMPTGFRENVIVMEFIGTGEEASPRLKDTRPTGEELLDYREQIARFVAGLYLAGLVHADLSEYNLLVQNGKLVAIDMGQALLVKHPNAKDFFERDVRNMANYFTKAGRPTTYEEMHAMVKAEKERMEKQKPKSRKEKG
ncbi:RIO-type serine/threonine-protein kinase Rio1 [uncultured archaeon]|nr:RIO-type serine/threonine-protein kinase Rio1 [uncultured archaeon]